MAFRGDVLTDRNLGGFDPNSLVADSLPPLDATINGYLRKYFAATVKALPGDVKLSSARQLINGIASYESQMQLFSVKPFRYAPSPNLPEHHIQCTAQNTIQGAVNNMNYMLDQFAMLPFAAEPGTRRAERAVTWEAHLDEDFDIHARGASGASTFSIDLGLGLVDRKNRDNAPNYKELWRVGMDTVSQGEEFGTRFIRTGSGIKEMDPVKSAAFHRFRTRYNILPQRLLGLVGLYFMRELEPDFAVAITNTGARNFSTLKNAKGGISYDRIFKDIGFEEVPSDDNWLSISNFGAGFYKVIARVQRREQYILNIAIEALKNMRTSNPKLEEEAGRKLFPLCEDDSPKILTQEILAAYGDRRHPWLGVSRSRKA